MTGWSVTSAILSPLERTNFAPASFISETLGDTARYTNHGLLTGVSVTSVPSGMRRRDPFFV